MEEPKSIRDVQKLTGRIAALNRFIPRSAYWSLPFFKVLRNANKFEWGPEQSEALHALKNHLQNIVKMTSPDEPTDHQAVSKKSDENCSKVTDKFTIQLGSFLIDLKNNMKDESDVPWCKKLIVGSKQETQVQAMGNPTWEPHASMLTNSVLN